MGFDIIENLSMNEIMQLYNDVIIGNGYFKAGTRWYSYIRCFYEDGSSYYVYGCTGGNNSCADCSSYNCGCCESACTKGSSLNKGGTPHTGSCYSHTIYASSQSCSW